MIATLVDLVGIEAAAELVTQRARVAARLRVLCLYMLPESGSDLGPPATSSALPPSCCQPGHVGPNLQVQIRRCYGNKFNLLWQKNTNYNIWFTNRNVASL